MLTDPTFQLEDYYSGGYFLIRSNKPDWGALQSDLLPATLISLSHHLCPRLNIIWGWIPGNPDAALAFGIPQTKLEAFLQWCKRGYETDMDIVSMFYSTDAARRFIKRFIPDTSGLHLIGAGLHQSLELVNWHEVSDEPVCGIEKLIEQHLPLEPGGEVLGFEPVSFSHRDFGCSWLCNYLHLEMYKLFGIRPNQYGLISSQHEAQQVYDWIAEDEMRGQRAEPEPYDYWLLVSYPLTPVTDSQT